MKARKMEKVEKSKKRWNEKKEAEELKTSRRKITRENTQKVKFQTLCLIGS